MKKIIVACILFLNWQVTLWAQDSFGEKVKNAQFQIVKITVNFLASDSKTFGKNKAPCVSCKDYESLKQFAKVSKLSKVPEYINMWKAIKLDTSETGWNSSLLTFKNSVHDTIAAGSKEFRQSLSTYTKYKAALDSISPVPATELEPNINTEPVIDNTTKVSASEKNKSLDWWEKQFVPPYVLYSIILVLIALLILIYVRTKKVINGLDKEISQYEKDNQRLKANHQSDKNAIKSKLELAEDKISTLESELKAERKKNQAVNQTQVNQPDKQTIYQPPKVETITKYARYADQGDGFTASDLLSESDSETIFEIVLTSPATAKYKIASNPAAQRYALSNAAYFLGKTCKYENAPSGQSNIYTDQQGELKLQGNKWLITNPAIISFR